MIQLCTPTIQTEPSSFLRSYSSFGFSALGKILSVFDVKYILRESSQARTRILFLAQIKLRGRQRRTSEITQSLSNNTGQDIRIQGRMSDSSVIVRLTAVSLLGITIHDQITRQRFAGSEQIRHGTPQSSLKPPCSSMITPMTNDLMPFTPSPLWRSTGIS